MNLHLTKIQHIGIPVINLEISKNLYQKLGFELVMTSIFLHNSQEGKVAMMKSGEIIMEIYQLPESSLAEIKSRKNGHIDHVAFDVENIDSTFEILKNEGFTIIEDAPIFLPFWENGCKYFNILGPDNERLEFNQILK